ncbi:unnamed protein product [Meloidogyne enterolobii]|uniref:Uncharacterized protein n=1 Tax=Meloidogyne enterolobii TaxID=390850 RepID=A0ACB0YU76_MELEN
MEFLIFQFLYIPLNIHKILSCAVGENVGKFMTKLKFTVFLEYTVTVNFRFVSMHFHALFCPFVFSR